MISDAAAVLTVGAVIVNEMPCIMGVATTSAKLIRPTRGIDNDMKAI
jgi:hypothetical protein